MELIEITDEAIVKLLEKQEKENFKYIRLGITGGGCAGFEYIFDSVRDYSDDDIVIDFGKLQFVVDKVSVPYNYLSSCVPISLLVIDLKLTFDLYCIIRYFYILVFGYIEVINL